MTQQVKNAELEMELYNKLLLTGILKESPEIVLDTENNKVKIDEKQTNLIENGFALGKYLIALKESLKVGITVDDRQKDALIYGDQNEVHTLFNRIERFVKRTVGRQSFSMATSLQSSVIIESLKSPANYTEQPKIVFNIQESQQKPKISKERICLTIVDVKDGVDISSLDPQRSLEQTESSLEFIINTLCRAITMNPKQAAALLTNNNEYLIHSVIKGIKGQFEPLISWYHDIHQNFNHLALLIESETEQFPLSENCQKVLQTISCGLYSHNLDICIQASKFLTKIYHEFRENNKMFTILNDWFFQKDGGLELSVHAFKKNPEFAEEFTKQISLFCHLTLSHSRVFKDELKRHYPFPIDYATVTNDIFPFLSKEIIDEIMNTDVFNVWIETFLSLSENIAIKDLQKSIRIVGISLMFTLLDKFAESKNPSAPAIYKALIFSIVDNPRDETVRQVFYKNFQLLFSSNSSIPIGLLIDPLLKRYISNELNNDRDFFKIIDFEFFKFISDHPKLHLQNSLLLGDLLMKIINQDPLNAKAAQVSIINLCKRFLIEDVFKDFMEQQLSQFILSFLLLEQSTSSSELTQLQIEYKGPNKSQLASKSPIRTVALPTQNQSPKKTFKNTTKRLTKKEQLDMIKEQDEKSVRKIKKSNIVNLCLQILEIKFEDVNLTIKRFLLETHWKFLNQHKFRSKAIEAILAWFGDSNTLIEEYERELKEQDERERIRKEEEMQANFSSEMNPVSSRNFENDEGEDRKLLLGYNSEEQITRNGSNILNRNESVRASMAVVPYQSSQRKTTFSKKRAKDQLDKMRKNKIEQEEQKKMEEERQRLLSARMKKKLKDELDKRKLALGIGPKQNNDDINALLFKEGTLEKDQERLSKLNSKMMIPQIILLELDQEEERDREAINAVMKKYSKLWKNLYYKYSNSGFSSKQISNFDQLNDKLQTMSFAEMTRLLKDHNTFPQLINKDALQQLFRLVNFKILNKNDLLALDYNGYLVLILQLAYYCFTKPPKDLSHLPPVETLKALISHFEEATKAKGNSVVLYQDPDVTSIGDQVLIKALNEKLRVDPNYPIPEGYFKQLDKTPLYEYKLSEQVKSQIPESSVIVVEIMDDWLNQMFGIHILEPIVSFEEKYKARPMIKNQVKPQAEALNYMKKIEKKIKPLEDKINQYSSMSALEKNKMQQEVRPTLNITLKLEVAQYSLKERPFIQEVAEVVEEMLQAVEKGMTTLPPRLNKAPGQVWNEARQRRVDDTKKEQDFKMNKEQLRKKRDDQVKSELRQIKEVKEKQLEEQKKAREDQSKLEKQQKIKLFEELRKKLGTKRNLIQQQRNLKLEEIEKKRQEEEEIKKQIEEQKKRERADFMKKQKDKLLNEFNLIKKTREDVALKEKEVQQKEYEFQMKMKQQMESFVKEGLQERGKEQQERQQINEFMKQMDVQNVFQMHDNQLKYLFKFYASQDKKDLDFNLERSMNTLNLREFVKFNYQQNIVPSLLQPDDAIQIFRQLIRERIEEMSGNTVENYVGDKINAQIIDYEYFKKAIIRIAIMAQDYLGGQKEDLLAEKLQKETKVKEEEIKKKEKLRKQVEDKSKAEKEAIQQLKEEFKQQTMKNSPNKQSPGKKMNEFLELNNSKTVGQEDEFFEKWLKQQEAKGVTSVKSKMTELLNSKKQNANNVSTLDDLREGQEIETQSQESKPKSLPRISPAGMGTLKKNRNIKLLKELTEKQAIGLGNVKIQQSKLRKDLNVGIITANTIESMFKFLGIEPEDNRYKMDKKLNESRIEIQGQKPNRLKKQIKPQSNIILFINNVLRIETENVREQVNASHNEASIENQSIVIENQDEETKQEDQDNNIIE